MLRAQGSRTRSAEAYALAGSILHRYNRLSTQINPRLLAVGRTTTISEPRSKSYGCSSRGFIREKRGYCTTPSVETVTRVASATSTAGGVTVNPLIWRLALPILGGFYVGFHFIGRSKLAQRLYIYRRLIKPRREPHPELYPQVQRPQKTKILRDHLNALPAGPCVIVGPDGSGKKTVLHTVIEGRKMVVFIDLKRSPVINGEELVTMFIASAGYLLPPTKVVSRLLLREEQKHSLSNEEVTKALECIESVFMSEKAKGWPHGIPVICIDDFHHFALFVLNRHNLLFLKSDAQFLKFMDWCLSMTDAKLCHVVFVTSFAFCHLELDTHSAFRRRREILQFGYASFSTVRKHFESISNVLISNNLLPLSSAEMDLLAAVCGGQMKDLDSIISGLLRGSTSSEIIDHLITDSLQHVEDALENTLIEGGKFKEDKDEKGDKKTRSYEKYLRLWRMLEIFSEKEFIPRRDLIRNVFQEHVYELEQYESANLVAYIYKKVAPSYESQLGRGLWKQKEIGFENEEHLGKQELLAKQDAIKADLVSKPTEEIEKKLLVEKEPLASTGAVPDGKVELKMVEKEAKRQNRKEDIIVPDVMQLFQSPELMVTPGTPRLHVAIQILLKEPRMTQQRRWIELQLQKKKLENKEEKLLEERVALRQEKKELVGETRALLEFKSEWLSSFGQEDFNEKKEAISEQSSSIFSRLTQNANELASVRSKLDDCERELKELDRISCLLSPKALQRN